MIISLSPFYLYLSTRSNSRTKYKNSDRSPVSLRADSNFIPGGATHKPRRLNAMRPHASLRRARAGLRRADFQTGTSLAFN
jgi:hypothetical protein